MSVGGVWFCLGLARELFWCAAGGALHALQNQGSLGGDGLMTRAGNWPRLLLHNVDRADRVFWGVSFGRSLVCL